MNWRRFLERSQADVELRQELESYIDITAEEYIARGMGVDEAREAARRKLGNVTPWTYAAVPLVLIVAAMLASYLPARRASGVDPMGALKAE